MSNKETKNRGIYNAILGAMVVIIVNTGKYFKQFSLPFFKRLIQFFQVDINANLRLISCIDLSLSI